MITLDNIQVLQSDGVSVIEKKLVKGNTVKPNYELLKPLCIKLSNGDSIIIPSGFVWDLSSVPKFIWWLLSPSGDFDLAYLIHDYLWIEKNNFTYKQKFTDDEMLKWADVLNGDTWLKKLDNRLRYYVVRVFGWLVWDGYIKIR